MKRLLIVGITQIFFTYAGKVAFIKLSLVVEALDVEVVVCVVAVGARLRGVVQQLIVNHLQSMFDVR